MLDDSTWRSLTRTNTGAGLNNPVTMPDAVVLPATLDPFGPTPTLTRVSPSSFLRGASTQQFGGASTTPLGFGSVKAARLQQAGLCSKFTPYSSFYQGIDATLRDSLLRGNGAACFDAGTIARVGYDNFAAFLAHEPGAPTNTRGGFLFNVDATIRTVAFPLTLVSAAQQTCHLTATAGFEPYLDNYGVLNVESGFFNINGNFLPMLIHADNSIACNGVHGFLPTLCRASLPIVIPRLVSPGLSARSIT